MIKLLCFIFGHKYFLVQKLTPQSRRVCCHRCSRSFAMNDDVETVIDWDASFHRLYQSHGIEIIYKEFESSKIT